MQCPFCKEEIQDGAIKCKHCGSMITNQPPTVSINPAPLLYIDYSQVPWYRKNWFAILCAFIFSPLLFFIALTGDIYYVRKGQLRKYGKGAKVFLIIFGLIALVSVATNIMGLKGFNAGFMSDYNKAKYESAVTENFYIAVRFTQAELVKRGIDITTITTDAVGLLNDGNKKSPFDNKLDAFVSGTSVGSGQVAISTRNIRSCAGCAITISADTNGDGIPDETVTLTDEVGSVE